MTLFLDFLLRVSVSLEKLYQTLKTMFDQISKHLEFRQKDSATRRIFYSLLSVWKCGQTQSSMLDIIQKTLLTGTILPCETWQTAAFKTFRCIFADTVLWARVFPTCINF